MFCSVVALEEAVKKTVKPMDHQHVDKDIQWFKDRVCTMENIAIYLWENLKKNLTEPDQLYEVKVAERETVSVIYRGN
ncbi:putative 6-pyruvoyltetrahydropterin synthase family protein [Apostichopus japonicus]|uniref:6-pyruvoyltetrahydropterin synthase n=2 Tax=Stichopus japonicus TaxID=307972 RepID=A0A2G8LMW5_STIJA|nr:putative 6-pyruvoyltetrahydropterin synthase family protein [Apostichopus japonicus]